MAENKLELYKQALEEMRKLRKGPLQDAIKAEQEKAKAAARESRQNLEATAQRVRDELSHQPRWLDSEIDIEAAMQSSSSGQKLDPSEIMINKWDDGNGNILFTPGDVGLNQIPSLSARITTQGQSLQTLSSDEQAQMRVAFQSPTSGENTAPYQDFLKSEALGKRFQELKQRNVTPPK